MNRDRGGTVVIQHLIGAIPFECAEFLVKTYESMSEIIVISYSIIELSILMFSLLADQLLLI